MTTSRRAAFASLALTLLFTSPAHAFGREGVVAVAARVLAGGAAEAEARHEAAWIRALEDPEAFAADHRGEADAPELLVDEDAARVSGRAPLVLAASADALRRALEAGDAAAAGAASFALAWAAVDLADPFLTSGAEDEPGGLRARLSERVAPEALGVLEPGEPAPIPPAEALDRAIAFARSSGARRAEAESLARDGEPAAIAAFQRERLAAALGFARALASGAAASAAPAASRPGLSAEPNPARGATTLVFALERACAVRLEFFDVSGRRVATWDAGARLPGLQRVALPAAFVARLPEGAVFVRAGERRGAASGRLIVESR